MYAITATGWRAIPSANDLQAGETAAETIPLSVMAAITARDARAQRDCLIAACDWTQLPDALHVTADYTAWRTYRQALRNVPAQAGFPETIIWPVAPTA